MFISQAEKSYFWLKNTKKMRNEKFTPPINRKTVYQERICRSRTATARRSSSSFSHSSGTLFHAFMIVA